MDAASIETYIDETLTATAEGSLENQALFGAAQYLTALAEEENPHDARWNMLYFTTSYVGWKCGDRDSTAMEANEVNKVTDEQVQQLRKHVARHPHLQAASENIVAGSASTGPVAFDKDELTVAFALQTVAKITEADDVVRAAELEFMRERFPITAIESMGLFANGAPTGRFDLVIRAALQVLAPMLSRPEKLELGNLFLDACAADEQTDPRELHVVFGAMALLGVSPEEFAAHIQELQEPD